VTADLDSRDAAASGSGEPRMEPCHVDLVTKAPISYALLIALGCSGQSR
jgi:hypothetical protein